MSIVRIALLVFCTSLLVVNVPLAVYHAWIDQETPDGYHSRAFHLLEAAVNASLGATGVLWALRRRPSSRVDPVTAPDRASRLE